MIKNPFYVNQGIEAMIRHVKSAPIEVYKTTVWKTFLRILRSTPQWSGAAVANWNLSVGAPDFSFNPNVGDEVDLWATNERARGDRKWIEFAQQRNRPKLKEITTRNHKVFFCNAVSGDTDGGKSSELYLQSLQDPAYWMQKLRSVNKPYETAQESIIAIAGETGAAGTVLRLDFADPEGGYQ